MRKTRIIAICNRKGGAGKTTTAMALASGLMRKGYKTLLIDMDKQGNASFVYRTVIEDHATVLDLLLNNAKVDEAIQHTHIGDIISADPALENIEEMLVNLGKEYRLKESIEPVLPNYDFIIIDTPPGAGILLTNSLVAATEVIIATTTDLFGIQGISQISQLISELKRYHLNTDIFISGILICKYNKSLTLAKSFVKDTKEIARTIGCKLFSNGIRECVAVREAQAAREDLFRYASACTTANDYEYLIEELIK